MILNPGDIAIDYAFARPAPGAIVAAGVRLVVRYISPTRSNKKNVTAAERDALHAAGLSILLVWENSTTDPLQGRPRGLAHGAIAGQYARDLGYPPDMPIIVAVDFGVTTAQLPVVLAYLQGFKETSGCEQGTYGKDTVITAAHDAGISTLGWQTVAWSGGRISPYADVLQHAHNVHPSILTLGAVDDNTVLRTFRSWSTVPDVPPIPPQPLENDMAYVLTNSDAVSEFGSSRVSKWRLMEDGTKRHIPTIAELNIYSGTEVGLSDAELNAIPDYVPPVTVIPPVVVPPATIQPGTPIHVTIGATTGVGTVG